MNKKLTIGIVSCNRLYYLRALIESAKKNITYPNIEWIIVDNASHEKGLIDYINKQNFFDKKILRKNRSPHSEHLEALNIIFEEASGEYIIILSDDVQIIRNNWEMSLINLLDHHNEITSVSLAALRSVTLDKFFRFNRYHIKPILRDILLRKKIRMMKKYYSHNEAFTSFGYMREPIDGVGMLTFSKKETWKNLLPWKTSNKLSLSDSSSGGEQYMLKQAVNKGVWGHMVSPNFPILATIITDKDGLNARVRGNKRFGKYLPPINDLYYESYTANKIFSGKIKSFEEIVNPIGFNLPSDSKGNLIKNSVNEKIFENID